MSGYRIGYLNPWSQAAENHACVSLRIAARRMGHEIVPVANSDEILNARLDFVLAVASTQPRTTHIPTFANIHEPRIRWWENEAYFWNLLTYDGYLTISDSLDTFLRGICAGFGKEPEIGTFFSTPQRQQVRTDVRGLAQSGSLGLCYFGTNWDPRSRPLFRALATRPYMQIRGPERSWRQIQGAAYHGSVPFDGQSVQAIYAANGAGLVVHSRNHTLDDVVSNRIFEICSVGAVAVAPDMPWLKSRFGDTLYYFDPWASADSIAERIDAIMRDLRADPAGAQQRAETARSIFEKSYSAEAMIDSSVRYFEGWKKRIDALRAPDALQPEIDVIVRVGGRPLETVERALRSIDAQSMGRFRVVFVRYKALDLSPLTERPWRNITGFEVIDCPDGTRAKTMAAGLSALKLPHFAVLDDDDFWLPDHVTSMWRVLKEMPANDGFAYCGFMYECEWPGIDGERRRLGALTPARGTIWQIVSKFGSINFLASRALLAGLDLENWTCSTAEDTLTVCHLISRAPRVAFTWRATVCISQSGDGSNFGDQSVRRKEDVLEVFLRLGPRTEVIERKFGDTPSNIWSWLGSRLSEVLEAKSKIAFPANGRLVIEEGMLGTSLHDREDIDKIEIPIDSTAMSLAGESRFIERDAGGGVAILPPPIRWAYAASIDVRQWLHDVSQQWVVLEFDDLDGSFGVGLLEADERDFYTRSEAPRRKGPVELWLFVGERSSVSRMVIQNWGTFEGNSATLRRMWAVRRKVAPSEPTNAATAAPGPLRQLASSEVS